MNRSWVLRTAAGAVLSLLFLFLAFQGVDFAAVVGAFDDISVGFLLAGILLILASLALRAVRWRAILASEDTYALRDLFTYNTIGWSLNYFLPIRSGEIVKAVLAAGQEDNSISYFTGTVVIARLFDFAVLLVFLFASAAYFDVTVPRSIVYIGAGLLGIGIAGIGVLTAVEHLFNRDLPIVERLEEYVAGTLRHLLTGLRSIETTRNFLAVVALSGGLWLFDVMAYFAFTLAFGFELPFLSAFFLLAVTSLGFAVPSSAGNIGPFQYFTVIGLGVFGIPKGTALAFSIFLHGAQYLGAVLYGAPLLAYVGWDSIAVVRGGLGGEADETVETPSSGRDPKAGE